MQETQFQSLGWEDPLEEDMATHSSIPAQRIHWTGEPGRLQSMDHKESDTTEAAQQQQPSSFPLVTALSHTLSLALTLTQLMKG